MEVNSPPWPDFKEHWTAPASQYRVTIWEQPELQDLEADMIGWGEVTYDLIGVQDVHEAIQWAEEQLAANDGPYSRSGTPVRDREYVLYAKMPAEDRFLQIARVGPDRQRRGGTSVQPPSSPPSGAVVQVDIPELWHNKVSSAPEPPPG